MSAESSPHTVTLGAEDLQIAEDVLATGSVVAGRYEIRDVLGSGGYAVVYRAWDRDVRSEVAIKVLRRDRNSAAAFSRFRREVSVARDVTSPRLVRVFDLGMSDGASFITMEVVPGGSLRRLIQRGGMPAGDAVRVAVQMLEGLASLHALSIVHRDVKPENVLLDANGDAKLADFGLARYLDEDHSRATVTGAVVGTSDYLSPEQALGSEVDERADLYAVGVVLFEMLTGGKPWRSVLARLGTPAPSVRSIRGDVPLWLSSIVARLLQRGPASRYASADEALAALRSRRADFRHSVPWRRVIVGGIAVVAVAAVIAVPQLFAPPRDTGVRFARLTTVNEHSVAAISSEGETLWRKEGIDGELGSRYALARLQPNQRPSLAVIFTQRYAYSEAKRQTLSFLDPDTGVLRREVHLPSGASSFPAYSNRYYPASIHAIDLDHDGVDEVIVTYAHAPEAPSYTVLYEPRLDRARVIFAAMGGHDFAAAHDLDGDGRPEILLIGINNAFNWINGMAAIRLRPWIGEIINQDGDVLFTPDHVSVNDRDLLWYAVLPRGRRPSDPTAFRFDPSNGQISIQYPNGPKIGLTREGFLANEPSAYAPDVRQQYRNSAYNHYRESARLLAGGFLAEAVDEISKAVEAAQKASDHVLLEVMERQRGKTLIVTGHGNEGEALLRRIAATSENESEVAYDAAWAFHLHGDLDRSVEWYQRGYGRGAGIGIGKSKHEFIQGIVLALSERGEWSRAEEITRSFRETFGWTGRDWSAMYLEFLRWRAGQMPRFDDIEITPWSIDLMRYWRLEFRNRAAEDPSAILRDVEQEIAAGADPRSGLVSLKAELLSRLGRTAEAAEAATRAWDYARSDRKMSIIARGHAAIVAERLKRIAGLEPR